jgi:predicted aldo/keto reductase-like oxidoreductase
MEECMMSASRLGWIDGIMITYNYRLMHTERMKAAVDACVEAGIGLTAMKAQGGWSRNPLRKTGKIAKKLKEQFIQRGFTEEQARLKAVWENSHIASICSEMPNLKILVSNAAASLDRTKLSSYEWKLLDRYAYETAPGYCAGCAHICNSAVNGAVPIDDIMRYLMYSRCYGDRERAKCLFRALPLSTRSRIGRMDYSQAELRCPQKMAIGGLMLEAVAEFS